MRFIIICYCLVLLPLSPLFAQNSNNYLQISANTGLNFTCNTLTSIENSQTLANALTIRVKSRNASCSIYARISAFNCPTGFSTLTYPVQLDYTSTNSNRYSNLVTVPLTLTSVDQRLFTQSSSNSVFSYYYNLVWTATDYSFPPGNYNFTIMFTMTQP